MVKASTLTAPRHVFTSFVPDVQEEELHRELFPT